MQARIPVRAIWALGITQVIGYGTLYYSFSVLAPEIAREFGWPSEWVYAALTIALLGGGFLAPIAGHLADRFGAAGVMTIGSVVAAATLVAAALSTNGFVYGAALLAMELAASFVLYSTAFAALAEEHRRAGRFEEAIAVCRDGLARYPAYVSARVTLGRALLDSGDVAGALAELEQAVAQAPDNLAAARALESAHTAIGNAPPPPPLPPLQDLTLHPAPEAETAPFEPSTVAQAVAGGPDGPQEFGLAPDWSIPQSSAGSDDSSAGDAPAAVENDAAQCQRQSADAAEAHDFVQGSQRHGTRPRIRNASGNRKRGHRRQRSGVWFVDRRRRR